MSKMEPHIISDDEDNQTYFKENPKGRRVLALVHPASKESVDHVLAQTTDGMDGRSDWVWVRLSNGDLILGVFPQGSTYFDVEKDAAYPA